MRTFQQLIAAALLLGLGLAAVPAGAQQTVTPTEPATVTTPAPAAPAADQPLLIPAPAGGTVQVEMDLRDDDLLGVFKSLLRGVGQGANSVPMPPDGGAGNGPNWSKLMAGVLSNADLSDVLKDVTHVHFVLYSLPGGGMPGMMPAPSSPQSKLAARADSSPMGDLTSFYETAFTAEGGHRIIYINTDARPCPDDVVRPHARERDDGAGAGNARRDARRRLPRSQ